MKTLARFLIPLTAVLIMTGPAFAESEYKYRFELFGAANIPRSKNFEITTPQSTYPMKGTQEFSTGRARRDALWRRLPKPLGAGHYLQLRQQLHPDREQHHRVTVRLHQSNPPVVH